MDAKDRLALEQFKREVEALSGDALFYWISVSPLRICRRQLRARGIYAFYSACAWRLV
jgi:hypothetical protein